MPPALASISRRLSSARPANCRHFGWVLVIGLHLAALAILIWSEIDLTSRLAILLAWGLVNFVWLMVLRRPAAAAALSLTLVVLLMLLSRFKHDILMMTVNFLDIMIVDIDSVAFLLTVFPNLKWAVLATALLALPAFGLLWWSDPFRVRLRASVLGAAGCLAGLSAAALTARCSGGAEVRRFNQLLIAAGLIKRL